MDSTKATEILSRQIEAMSGLEGVTASYPAFKKWKRDTEVAIENIFGKSGRHLSDFVGIRFSPGSYYPGIPVDASVKTCQFGLDLAHQILQSMIEEIAQFGLTSPEMGRADIAFVAAPREGRAQPNQRLATEASKLIFISHSSTDKDIADALLDLLCSALHLRASNFLCTSVDGAKLPGGAQTDSSLRTAIRDLPAFLSILTPSAIASTYVLFELGARWGSEKHHVPLLGKGAGPEVLKEPLKSTNALKLYHVPDVLQLITDLSKTLNLQPDKPEAYHAKIIRVVAISEVRQPAAEQVPKSPSNHQELPPLPSQHQSAALLSRLSDDARRLLVEASGSTDGNVSKMRYASVGEVVSVNIANQDFMGDVQDKRACARWVHAFNELVRAGCFAHSGHEGIYAITHVGYQLADILKKQSSG